MIDKCNLCWWEVILLNPWQAYWSRYKHHTDDGEWIPISYIYRCKECSWQVWCHWSTEKPLGTLADKETRNARHLTHKLLDPLWENSGKGNYKSWSRWKRRRELYKMIWKEMWIEKDCMHIWMFDINKCREAYRIILDYKKTL